LSAQLDQLLLFLNTFESQKGAASGLASLDGSSRVLTSQLSGWFVKDATYTNDTVGASISTQNIAVWQDAGVFTVSITGVALNDVILISGFGQITGTGTDGQFRVVANSNGGAFALVPGTMGNAPTAASGALGTWSITGKYVCTSAGTVVIKGQIQAAVASGPATLLAGACLHARVFRP
jgi:hypothetical protein